MNRKSFSVEKPIDKSQYLVQVKYQQNGSNLGQQSRGTVEEERESSGSELSRLLQKNVEPLSKERRNLLMGRERKALKTNSSKKITFSEISSSKEEKVKELDYLQRKYTKLISEFNWFSERFLRVIEEEV